MKPGNGHEGYIGERERERDGYVYIYICMYTYIHIYICIEVLGPRFVQELTSTELLWDYTVGVVSIPRVLDFYGVVSM